MERMKFGQYYGGKCAFCKKDFLYVKVTYENLKLNKYFQFCSEKCYVLWCRGA